MSEAANQMNRLLLMQLRWWAAATDLALQRATERNGASLEAARRSLAAQVKQCEALLGAHGSIFRPIGYAPETVPGAEIAAQWQRAWIDMVARTQLDVTNLFNRFSADWSRLAGSEGAVTGTLVPTPTSAPAFGPFGQIFESMMRSWSAASGAAVEPAAAEAPRKGTRKRGPSRTR